LFPCNSRQQQSNRSRAATSNTSSNNIDPNLSTMAASMPDNTELNTLFGPGGKYKLLVTNCFTDPTEGNLTWSEAKTFTLVEFLDAFDARNPIRRGKLKSWIAYYELENGFKQQPHGKLRYQLFLYSCIQRLLRFEYENGSIFLWNTFCIPVFLFVALNAHY
jgi:hypothetical protein